ncbi:hypothetical protein [Natronincola ferrireducens]|uniref:Tellurite resistance protein TerB n=1 Tax=Natronincola ferrireducens TaxID=393762 RepID=A0A1G8ZHA6_9FIRM|nr:hypothetical protein [Natronincola ferrireducens]SDK14441.1 hypothetical protein SAMN05660472_00864 [Natronincola ferrireducens]
MTEKKVRGLEDMPPYTKLNYFKILIIMANTNGEVTQLEMVELYRLMAKNKLSQVDRLVLLSWMEEERHNQLLELCDNLYEELNDQEKNIIRFSLIKDLIIIMGADNYEAPEEMELFNKMKEIFCITEEQLGFLKEEYETDKTFFAEETTDNSWYDKFEETFLTATAIGVPITVLYYQGSFKREWSLCRRLYRKPTLPGNIAKAVVLGGASYKMLKWFLEGKRKKAHKLKEALFEAASKVHERADDYLTKDIQKIQEELQHTKEEVGQRKALNHRAVLLQKTLGNLRSRKPQLL